MLEILHGRGEIAVAGREGKQRLWDLADRVFPETETVPLREAERLIEKKRATLARGLEGARRVEDASRRSPTGPCPTASPSSRPSIA